MKKHEVMFTVETKNGVVNRIGKSFIEKPHIKYNGKPMPWFDDSKLLKKDAQHNK